MGAARACQRHAPTRMTRRQIEPADKCAFARHYQKLRRLFAPTLRYIIGAVAGGSMFVRVDLMLIGAGVLVSVLGAALVDLWLIGRSFSTLVRRDGSWAAVGLLLGLAILGGLVGFVELLLRVLPD